MQWFFKGGQNRPFEMIGYIAAVIVFVSAGIVRWAIGDFSD